MKDEAKTQKQLLNELVELRQRITELERLEIQQKLAVEVMQQSETRYRAVVEDQTELICRFDPDATLNFVNESYCRFFNKKREDLIGRSFMPLIPTSDRQKVKAHLDTLGPKNPVETHEHRVIGQDGEIFWQQWTNRAVFDDEGRIIEFQSVGRDITDRKRAEKALRQAHDELELRVQERTQELLEANKQLEQEIETRKLVEKTLKESVENFRALAENANEGILIAVGEGTHVYANNRALEITGYGLAEFLKIDLRRFTAPDEVEKVEGRFKGRLRGEKVTSLYETALVRKSGEIFPAELSSARTVWEGQPATIVIFRDITERRLVVEALKKSEERYRNLVDNALVGIYTSSVKGNILYVNKALANILEFDSPEELISQGSLARYKNPEDRKILIDKLIKTGTVDNFEFEAFTKKNDPRVLLTSATLDGDTISGVIVNITERKLVEESLRRREYDLGVQTKNLEEVNAALKVLLKHREEDKVALEEKVLSNVNKLVLPYVERLKKSGLNLAQSSYMEILELNLQDVVSPFSYKLSSAYLGLTPTEIHVANLVKEAKDTKTIAQLLNMSPRTVESHRQNIRKKLGLKNKKINLRTQLLSMQ